MSAEHKEFVINSQALAESNMPTTLHVVRPGHNRITFCIYPPREDRGRNQYECGLKTVQRFEKHGPGWMPVHWRWIEGRENFVQSLMQFEGYVPEDEFVISYGDYDLLKEYFQQHLPGLRVIHYEPESQLPERYYPDDEDEEDMSWLSGMILRIFVRILLGR